MFFSFFRCLILTDYNNNNNNNNDILLRTHGPYHRHKAQKVVSYTSAHITETVFAHDQHWEEQSSLSSPQLYRHLQKHRKWINHTVGHYITGVRTCPTLREARHFPSTSYFFMCGVYTVSTYFYYTKAILMRNKLRNNSRTTTAFGFHTGVLNN